MVVTEHSAKETATGMGQVPQALERAPLAKAYSAWEPAPAEMGCLSVNQVDVRAAAVRASHGRQRKKIPPTTKPSTDV